MWQAAATNPGIVSYTQHRPRVGLLSQRCSLNRRSSPPQKETFFDAHNKLPGALSVMAMAAEMHAVVVVRPGYGVQRCSRQASRKDNNKT